MHKSKVVGVQRRVDFPVFKTVTMGKIRLFHQSIAFLFVIASAKADRLCEAQVTSEMKIEAIKTSITTAKSLFPKCREIDEISNKCGRGDKSLAHLNWALETLDGLNVVVDKDGGYNKKCPNCPKCPPPKIIDLSGPADCSDVYKIGNRKSGVYTIYPRSRVSNTKPLRVYCDMDTDGGGWTVIQRRANYSEQTDFYQDWETYKKGFGDITRDFWLGNDNIFTLTNQGVYSIRIDLLSNDGEYRYSKHNNFWIGDEESNYVLHLQNFTGNVSDDFSRQDKRMFSTKDRQNDGHSANDACAVRHRGAWWWPPTSGCGHLNLNGVYLPGKDDKYSVWWWDWLRFHGLFFVEMKIRHRYANLDDRYD